VSGAAAQPLGLAGHRAGAGIHAGEDNGEKREARASLSKKREEREWEKGNDPNRVLHPFYVPPNRFGSPLGPTQDPDRTGPLTRAHFILFAMHTLHNTACTPCISFLFLSCILMSFCTIMLFSFAFYSFIRLNLSCCIFLFISHFYLFHIKFSSFTLSHGP